MVTRMHKHRHGSERLMTSERNPYSVLTAITHTTLSANLLSVRVDFPVWGISVNGIIQRVVLAPGLFHLV